MPCLQVSVRSSESVLPVAYLRVFEDRAPSTAPASRLLFVALRLGLPQRGLPVLPMAHPCLQALEASIGMLANAVPGGCSLAVAEELLHHLVAIDMAKEAADAVVVRETSGDEVAQEHVGLG